MKKNKQRLVIPFSGLKEGMHQFKFDVNSMFFKQFDYSIIKDAEVHIDVDFEKKPSLLSLYFEIKGNVHTVCDRCSDPLSIEVKGDEELIVKFGEDSYDQTDEIKILSEGEYELDITDEVYEYIHLLLPNKVAHKDIRNCNQEIIKKLEELSHKKESEKTDPRWSELEKLKKQIK